MPTALLPLVFTVIFFLRDGKLVRIRFVLVWCANVKLHISGCRFESLTVRQCLKFLNCPMSIWLLM